MENFIEIISKLSLSAIAGYLFGSNPLAYQISKRKGINIFKTGTGLAGASNVLHSVGKKPAAIVYKRIVSTLEFIWTLNKLLVVSY